MVRSKGLPSIETIEKGKRWHRVYWESVRPTRFTESRLIDPPWRFSPFPDNKTGEVVQALYMGFWGHSVSM
jgi:ribosomal protein L11 methylase PrmA